MPATTRIRLSRATAERLLDGRAAPPSDLGRLLAAATAPGTAEELAGEAAAVAAFAAARDSAPVLTAERRPSAFGTALSRLFGAKVVIGIALAAGASGGIALTTTAGAPQEPPAAVQDVQPAGTPAAGGSDVRVRPTGGSAAQLPAPELAERCRAWLAGGPDAAADPAFADLVTAAGHADQVAALCAGATDQRAPDTAPDRADSAPGRPPPAPGRSADAPGQAGTSPGRAGTAPGQAGTAPGQGGSGPPGQTGTAPGRAGTAPGQSDTDPGRSGDAPGRSGDAPGRSGDAPGQSAGAPGRADTAPGRATDRSEPPGQANRNAPQEPPDAEPPTDR